MSEHAREQAKAQAESISAMVAALNMDYERLEELRELLQGEEHEQSCSRWDGGACDCCANELAEREAAANDCESEDKARERIQEDALDVHVRSGWAASKDEFEAEEFNILLCTGGPAVRIIGELRYGEPHRAWLEYQDWGTPWTEYHGDGVSIDDLLSYCRCFYFGE